MANRLQLWKIEIEEMEIVLDNCTTILGKAVMCTEQPIRVTDKLKPFHHIVRAPHIVQILLSTRFPSTKVLYG